MTYKEFTECARPELVQDYFTGGAYGCPSRTHFKDGVLILKRDCKEISRPLKEATWRDIYDIESDCAKCWNTEMDANETARAVELYGSEWYLSALAYIGEKKHDTAIQK